jgi:hypothetical protein
MVGVFLVGVLIVGDKHQRMMGKGLSTCKFVYWQWQGVLLEGYAAENKQTKWAGVQIEQREGPHCSINGLHGGDMGGGVTCNVAPEAIK